MSVEKEALDLDAIRARDEAATAGPWRVAEQTHGDWYGIQDDYSALASVVGPRDAEFIAHARTDVPELLTEVDRLAAVVAEKTAEVEEAQQRANRILAINHSALEGLRNGKNLQWVRDTLAEGSRSMVRDETIDKLTAEVPKWQRATFESESDKNAAEGRARIAEHHLDQALGVVAAVKALADEWDAACASWSPVTHDSQVVGAAFDTLVQIRAVLGPVSGAVEGAGDLDG